MQLVKSKRVLEPATKTTTNNRDPTPHNAENEVITLKNIKALKLNSGAKVIIRSKPTMVQNQKSEYACRWHTYQTSNSKKT